MKLRILLLVMVVCTLLSCKNTSQNVPHTVAKETVSQPLLIDTTDNISGGSETQASGNNCSIALAFYKTYAQKYNKIYEQDFINYGEVYSVNFNTVDKFIKEAKLHKYFTERYIKEMQDNFLQIDKSLKKHPQSDGPVDGLESDFILLTQETDELLAQIETSNITCSERGKDDVIIDFKNSHTLILSFKGDKIDAISHGK